MLMYELVFPNSVPFERSSGHSRRAVGNEEGDPNRRDDGRHFGIDRSGSDRIGPIVERRNVRDA
jgi:hypothetical protein